MLTIHQHLDLAPYTTFGISVLAELAIEVHTLEEAKEAIDYINGLQKPMFILGGGSNMLLTKAPEGVVLINKMEGMEIVEEGDKDAIVKVGGGVNWHSFVLDSLEKGLFGLENLSLIPGTVGAAPIQNIGAYGVEQKEAFVKLEAVSLKDASLQVFEAEDCKFGYRDSIFKGEQKGKMLIAFVYYKLSKHPKINSSYGAISTILNERGIVEPSPKDISNAVIEIRRSKLPDPKIIGNAGSFFKNPVVPAALVEQLKSKFPKMPYYPTDDPDMLKVPAGWLIEKAGWKGYRKGNVGVHSKQALVLVNHGGATGQEIYDLSKEILESVEDTFGILLEREVNIF